MKTKTIISFATVALFTISITLGQNSKRVAAYNYMNSGQLDKAKIAIDAASIHPKTANSYKVWWYRGNIYQGIATNKKFQALDENAGQKSLEAFIKALALNFKDLQYHNLDILNKKEDLAKFKKLIENKAKVIDGIAFNEIWTAKLPTLSNLFINSGVIEFKDTKNYKKALDLFENSLFISDLSNKLDTPIYYYAALAAEKANELEKADAFYKVITETGYGANDEERATMYYMKAKIKIAQKDTVAYINTLQEGIDKYSEGSAALVTELINYYLENKQSNKALNYLKLAIDKDPANPSYYFAQGTLYDNKNVLDSAEISYKKAIELKPDYFDANFNLGAMYFNNAATLNDKANDEKDFKKYEILKKEADAEFLKALPYIEKAHDLNPKDTDTMQSLKTLYYRSGQMEKYEEINALLKK